MSPCPQTSPTWGAFTDSPSHHKKGFHLTKKPTIIYRICYGLGFVEWLWYRIWYGYGMAMATEFINKPSWWIIEWLWYGYVKWKNVGFLEVLWLLMFIQPSFRMAMKTVVKPSVQKNRSIIPRPAVPREILETIQAHQLLEYDHGGFLKDRLQRESKVSCLIANYM